MHKRMLRNLLLLFGLVISLSGFSQSKSDLNAKLPEDPKVTKGVLENGLTYYIRSNSTPQNRADMYLVVRAGSIDEDDDQQGLAHFVEHMAFNGTKNFPKNELIKYLESLGIGFGPEINAYTSFDETVYMIKVPLDEEEYIQNGLQVMYDWACQVTDSDEEIEKERGIIHEEWRGGKGANERMRQKWLPVFFKGSKYAERMPIGKIEIIDNGKPEVLRRFRADWYRPDLQALIVVGDFDQEEMVKRVKEKFSAIPKPKSPREKKYYDIPGHKETLVSIVTDKEATQSIAEIYYKHVPHIDKTLGDYRQSIVNGLYNDMIGRRLSELAQSGNPPFIAAGSGYGGLIEPHKMYYAAVSAHENKLLEGIRAVLQEVERVKRHGFTETELERVKTSRLANIERSYNERDKQQSIGYVEEYKRNFLLTEEPFPGIENEVMYHRTWLPEITLYEVNRLAAKWITPDNRVVVVTAPEKEGLIIPSEEQILQVIKDVENSNIEAYVDKVSDKPLIDKDLKSGVVAEERKLEEVGAVEWTLSNGAKVVYKVTDFKDDEILFGANSKGGSSLYGQDDDISADLATAIISMSGISEFDKITLDKMLTGKVFSVSPYISEINEGFSGRSSVKDFETLLQILHLYFTDLRVDEVAYSSYMQRISSSLMNRGSSPEAAFSDTLQVTSANYHPRRRPMSVELLEEANPAAIKRIATERFSNAADFNFFFVGNIDVEVFKSLVEKYIGSLPSSSNLEKWKDLNINPPTGVIEKVVYKGQEAKSINYTIMHGDFEYTPENGIAINALGRILSTRLLEVIREENSSVYSINASAGYSKFPTSKYNIVVMYGTDPDKVEQVREWAFDEMKKLIENGPTEAELATAKEKILREREVALRENNFWLNSLVSGFSVDNGDFSNFNRHSDLVKQLTIDGLKEDAKKWFNFKNYFSVSLKPEPK